MGEVRVKVLLNGLELGTQLLNYTPSPTIDALRDLIDVHVQLVAESVAYLENSGHSLVDLDQRLTNVVQQNHRASDQMFTQIQYTSHARGKCISRS